LTANSAWTVLGAAVHSLLRWTRLLGLPDTTIRGARTARRRLLQIAGRLTRLSRFWTLHLPARWPATATTSARANPRAADKRLNNDRFAITSRPLGRHTDDHRARRQRRSTPARPVVHSPPPKSAEVRELTQLLGRSMLNHQRDDDCLPVRLAASAARWWATIQI
jgi:hypothetical protein